MQTKYAKTLGFCLQILLSGTSRARSLVNYLMSLASGGHLCKHPVDLTLQPHSYYTYSNLTKVVKYFHYMEAILRDFFTAYADPPKVLDSGKNYYTIGYDFTKLIKAYSHSLESRVYVLMSNPVVGKVCVTAGYVLGALHYLSGAGGFAPMVSLKRINAQEDKDSVALSQIGYFMEANEKELEKTLLFLLAMYAAFGKAKILSSLHKHKQLVGLVRLRQGIKVWTLYRGSYAGKGAKRIYGDQYYLFVTTQTKPTLRKGVTTTITQQSITDLTADDEQTQKYQLQNGKWVIATLRRYNNMLISTKGGANMKDKSFDLVMATLQDADSGESVFTRPLFIAITGEFKSEVSTWEAYKEYLQRFDVEKTYRFSNNNLMMNAFQTCEATHLDSWLLYVARYEIEQVQCPPWQKYLNNNQSANAPENQQSGKRTRTPAQAQKSIGAIFYTFDKSLFMPKVQKNGKGRTKGIKLPKRPKYPIVKKHKKIPKQHPKQLNC